MDIRYWALGLMLALGSAAHADDNRGWYAGAGVGQFSVDIDGADFDESDTALRFFGGWKMNQTWSFEAGYTAFSDLSDSTTIPLLGTFDTDIEISSLDVYARPTWPLNDQWELFGIIGVSRIEADIKLTIPLVGTVSDSSSDTELMFGFGGSYKFDDTWAVRGEFVTYNVDGDLSMFSIAGTYNFH
jgi:opacity protein-like surface antigen